MSIYGNHMGGRYVNYGRNNQIQLHGELMRTIHMNGLDAFIEMAQDGRAQLVVRGMNSHTTYGVFRYDITQQQMSKLMQGGGATGAKNKAAYEEFNRIVSRDFGTPENYTVARNVGVTRSGNRNRMTSVNMGWNGVGTRHPYWGFMMSDPMRHDGRRLPGESAEIRRTADGWYRPTAGYYYKGDAVQRQQQQQQQLNDIKIEKVEEKLLVPPERPQGKAVPLSEVIKTENDSVYGFTKDKWEKVLNEHGIFVVTGRKDKNGVIHNGIEIKAKGVRRDLFYDMTPEQLQKIMADKATGKNGVSIQERLDVINSHEMFKNDFQTGISKEMLETKDYVDVKLKPEVREVIEKDYIEQDRRLAEKERMAALRQQLQEATRREQQRIDAESERCRRDPNAVYGRNIAKLMAGKEFFAQVAHGRHMVVAEIRVDNNLTRQERTVLALSSDIADMKERQRSIQGRIAELEKQPEKNGRELEELRKAYSDVTREINVGQEQLQAAEKQKSGEKPQYTISALVNGEWMTKEISEKEYQRFLMLDDKHRLMFFDDKFDNIAIKDDDRQQKSTLVQLAGDGRTILTREEIEIQQSKNTHADGIDLKEKKGFYTPIKGGREVDVQDVSVSQVAEGKYRMTAVIDGKTFNADVSQKFYNKFLAVDDNQRFKMMADTFKDQVAIKTRPEYKLTLGDVLRTGLEIVGGTAMLARETAETAYEVSEAFSHHHGHRPMPGPELYGGGVFVKRGVVGEMAIREAMTNFSRGIDDGTDQGIGGRGR